MRAVTLLLRLSGEVSQASIRRFPCPQKSGHHPPAREIYLPPRSGDAPISLWQLILYHKTGPADGIARQKMARPLFRQPFFRPQACPGSLSRVSA